MKPVKKIGDVGLVDRMSKEQVQNYWLELKEARFDSYYYRELLEKIRKMNPNIIWPEEEELLKIEQEALNISLWEENWDRINSERINRGGVDYSIFRDTTMWVEKEYRISGNE
jgi:hypothetical protein